MSNVFSGSILASVCVGLFALVLGGIGAFLLVQYFRNKQKAQESTNWPSVEGKITGQNIRVDEVDSDDSFRISYIPVVHFEYSVNNAPFEGKRLAFGSEPSFSSRKKAEAFLASYPVGQIVPVFYNPEKPSEAVLSQTLRKMTASLIVGIVLIVVGVCSLCPSMIGLISTLSSL